MRPWAKGCQVSAGIYCKGGVVKLDDLLEPISDSSPAGEACSSLLEFEQVVLLSEWLLESAAQLEREREAKVDPNTKPYADKGNQALEALGEQVKGILGKSPGTAGVRKELEARATELLKCRGKDLEVVAHLAVVWVGAAGVSGLADAFELAEALLARFETNLHPVPDADDDPVDAGRANVLSILFNDVRLVTVLRETVLLPANRSGRLAMRDIDVIDQVLHADQSDGAKSVGQICAIATDAGKGDATAAGALLSEHLKSIDRCLDSAARVAQRFKPGSIRGDRVLSLLRRVKTRLAEAIGLVQPNSPEEDGSATQNPVGAGSFGTVPHGSISAASAMSRDEARRLILDIARYIERTEPSHPAPLLLRRAEKLLGAKSFFEIVRNMTPDGMHQLEMIAGRPEVSDDSSSK